MEGYAEQELEPIRPTKSDSAALAATGKSVAD